MTETLARGYSSDSSIVLSESFPMSTNMTGFKWFSKIFVLWTKVALALWGLRSEDWGMVWPFPNLLTATSSIVSTDELNPYAGGG